MTDVFAETIIALVMSRIGTLSRFETFARDLVEGTFNRFLGERSIAAEMARQLFAAMDDSLQDNLVADIYQVSLFPADLKRALSEYPALSDQLARYVSQLAEEANLILAGPVRVELLADPQVAPKTVKIEIEHTQPASDSDTEMLPETPLSPKDNVQAVDAFLIINGRRHYALQQPVVSIGRHLDNDIVLEESSVSRKHSQLRWQYGRFVIYDLGSKSGTMVNGLPVTECVLKTGDVITLGSAAIIFGQEEKQSEPVDNKPKVDNGSTRALNSQNRK